MTNRVPFRRGRSTTPSEASSTQQEQPPVQPHRESAWDARRRRKQKQAQSAEAAAAGAARIKNNRRNQELPTDNYDPYDSDPGESYRDHCERLKGDRTRSCLTMPRFLQNKVDAVETEATAPPSPMEDVDSSSPRAPASLPKDLARVRYSLRTTIGDGSLAQATAAMERRELRPNFVHINVSHWSAFGGRDYMEDRYVFVYWPTTNANQDDFVSHHFAPSQVRH